MNELIKVMSTDMNISPYKGETLQSFMYRVLYSALGQWCIKSASSPDGITKHAQTALLKELIDRYIELFPDLTEKLVEEVQSPLPVFIRRVYEETGYLITNSSNRNFLSNYGRGLQFASKYLLFGINNKMTVNGLGVFTDDAKQKVLWKELLIRDNLNCEQYLSSKYDLVSFNQRDISTGDILFFNPKTNSAPSSSWSSSMETEKTIARNPVNGMYYRVMDCDGELLFDDEVPNQGSDDLTSFEYRRVYFALKKHYGHPIRARIKSIDDLYSKVSLSGHLPNREYYLMLLCSWPCQTYSDKREFVIKSEYLALISEMLENLGFEITGG